MSSILNPPADSISASISLLATGKWKTKPLFCIIIKKLFRKTGKTRLAIKIQKRLHLLQRDMKWFQVLKENAVKNICQYYLEVHTRPILLIFFPFFKKRNVYCSRNLITVLSESLGTFTLKVKHHANDLCNP